MTERAPGAVAIAIRDSRRATAAAVLGLPVVLYVAYGALPDLLAPALGVKDAHIVGWTVATFALVAYALVHLLAAFEDVNRHPNRGEWGPVDRTAAVGQALARQNRLLLVMLLGVVLIVHGFLGSIGFEPRVDGFTVLLFGTFVMLFPLLPPMELRDEYDGDR